MLKRPCLVCGIPTTSSRCERHRKPGHHTYTETTTERGLGTAHRRIAKRVLTEERTCWLCGRGPTTDDPLEADHIVPRSKGGRTVRWNYHAAHRSCNRSRGDRMVGEPPTEPEDDTNYAVPWRPDPPGG